MRYALTTWYPRAGRSGRAARISVATTVAATVAVVAGPRQAAADLAGFNDFAPYNQSLADPTATVYNGYYNNGSTFQLTTAGVNGQAVTGFGAVPQDVTGFVAQYTYLGTYGASPADGVAFVVHNDPRGAAALGANGGAMGVGGSDAQKITPSAETYLSIYYADNSAISFGTNGGNTGFFYTGAANAKNQYPIDVRVTCSGNQWVTTLRDGSTGQVYSRADAIAGGLPSLLGSSKGYVGFGGGTGGLNATQVVSNFKFNTVTGVFNPIKVSGFTRDVVVESGATNFQTAVTATLDNGTDRDGDGNLGGATFYERGWNAAAPTTGLPSGGQVVTSGTDANHRFALAPASASNALLLNANNTAGSLLLDIPTRASALSILTTTGSGSGSFDVRVKFADGSPDEVATAMVSPDWFNGGGVGLAAAGRVNPDLSTDTVGEANPRLYQEDFALANATSPIASLEFTYLGGAGNTFIFGVSGVSDVPEPATAGLLMAGGLAALARRRARHPLPR